jgi:hypothetical protein
MPDRRTARPCLRALMALLLLSSSPVPGALATEWDALRDRQREALRAAAGRIAEIESKERGAPIDREKLADKITRDRIARVRTVLKSGGVREGKVPGDVGEGQRLGAVTRDWGPNGAERRKLQESRGTLQRNLERVDLNLAAALEAAGAMAARVPQSGVPETLARIEPAVSEAGERLSARWQREHAARERERQERERQLGERERGVR